MIKYVGFRLENGLQVYVHEDPTTPMAVVNLTYNVGSKDENEKLTGFAHLFEHLMFGGTKQIPSYDQHVHEVGGECNAFTSSDLTNYFITLPATNVETAFWLESDRMNGLAINERTLDIQRQVVIEEYKQRYLNQPYGDLWLRILPLSYSTHPYRWATIGKEIAHIENAAVDDVRAFYEKYYTPQNAVLVVAGNVTAEHIEQLTVKWFGNISPGNPNQRNLPQEPLQTASRHEEIVANVPLNAIAKTFHMPGRFQEGFFEADLLSDVLGRGKSSRLYQSLVNEKGLFNQIQAQTTSTLDPGLLIIKGFLNPGIPMEAADQAISELISKLIEDGPSDEEVERVKNQAETTLEFSQVEILNRAMNLGYAAIAGNPDLVNEDLTKLQRVTREGIHRIAPEILRSENCSTLYYRSNLA